MVILAWIVRGVRIRCINGNQKGVENPQPKYSFISSQKEQIGMASISKTLPEIGQRKKLGSFVVGIFTLPTVLVLLRFKNSHKRRE